MDTRTPRTPDPSGRRPGDTRQGGPSGFFDEGPALSTVKVPSDPAEVVVTHASFRVQLAPQAAGSAAGAADAISVGSPAVHEVPVVRGAGTEGARRTDTARSGAVRTDPARTDFVRTDAVRADVVGTDGALQAESDRGAARLSHVTGPGARDVPETAGSTTQVLPRIDEDTLASPTVIGPRGPRGPRSGEQHPPQQRSLLHGVRPARGAFDGPDSGGYGPYGDLGDPGDPRGGHRSRDADSGHGGEDAHPGVGDHGTYGQQPYDDGEFGEPALHHGARPRERSAESARRQAYYPGRRMNLGVVLLPMRIFLGFISVYAGMGKLCDPVYFDADGSGSMVNWLRSLEPWAIASPLYDFALAHPVGAGLTVAFLQIVIGVLTVCGLWQRLAASIGALLSAALLMTVSWSSGPAYEAPDIIYLAAWSPLIIAGAPVYSVDGRLAADAWRKLGPRAGLRDLRRRVLRRGAVLATLITGVALLTGSMLGGAVRATHTAKVPEPDEPPTNRLPGSPVPEKPGAHTDSERPAGIHTGGAVAGAGGARSGDPSSSASPGGRGRGEDSRPRQRETVQVPRQSAPGARPPQQSTPGDRSTQGGGAETGAGSGGAGGTGTSTGGGNPSTGGGTGGSSSGGSGGGLGGLLG